MLGFIYDVKPSILMPVTQTSLSDLIIYLCRESFNELI